MGVGLQGFIDIEKERVLQVGDDHPQSPALAAGQAARVQIGVILEFFDGFHHAGAG